MNFAGARPSPEEIAAIIAALEAALPGPRAGEQAKAAMPRWRIAARLPLYGHDTLRRAHDAWRLSRDAVH